MATWYALVCLTDQFTPTGKLDYKAGDVKSYGTVLSGNDAQLLVKGIKAVSIGEFGESGPDFNVQRFDVIQEKLVAYSAPKDEADLLLDKANWTSADSEKALRLILSQGK
jgi:hypothetical protein